MFCYNILLNNDFIKFKVNTFWRDDRVTHFNYDCGFKIRFKLYVELISRSKLFISNVSLQKVYQLRWMNSLTFMTVLIFHWLVCRISGKLKLKRSYEHVNINRPFDCSLAVGVQRSNPSLQIVHVLSLIAMIAMKTHHCDWSIWYPYRSNCNQPPVCPCNIT